MAETPRLLSSEEIKNLIGFDLTPNGSANNGPNRNGHAVDDLDAISIISPFPIDVRTIPLRPWVVPGLLMRRQLSVLVAPPGSGKSLLTIQISLLCASSMTAWGGWKCTKQYRVLIISVEEDADELRRRLYAAASDMGIDADSLGGLFFADADSIVIAKIDARSKSVTTTPVYDEIIRIIEDNQIDICIVDPFAETFEVDENSNSELKWAAMLWRGVARKTLCTMLLVHHTKKYSANMAGDMDAGRGAGAVTGVARIMVTLFGMTQEEALSMDIDDDNRSRYVRFDDAKANMNLISNRAKWFIKKTITLENGVGEEPGDDVGVLVPWIPPSVFDGLDDAKVVEILNELECGLRDDSGRPNGEWYGLSSRGGSMRWAGRVIKDRVACTDQDATKILKLWIKTGMIEEVDGYSKNGKRIVKRIVVKARPGVTDEVAFGD